MSPTADSRPPTADRRPPTAHRMGVLLMAHGTPDSLDDLPTYLANVRGGRPPSPKLAEEMRHNYSAIGGRSPLTDISRAQAAALAERLGGTTPVFLGMRNWSPFIADAVKEADAAGVQHLIGIPLAPQYSSLSVQKYQDAARAALLPGMTVRSVPSYHAHPALIAAFAARVRECAPEPDEDVIFTAHSLPKRVAEGGDPYPFEVYATARLVAEQAGVAKWRLAYQSAGRTSEPWLGPDLSDMLRARAEQGARKALVVPIGFVCDHTEVLFDIDVQAAANARAAGVALRRTASLNTSPLFVDLLASLVRAQLHP